MDQTLRRKLDRITDILWAGGVTNPVTYIEQAKTEIPNLQTYRKGAGEKIPDWTRLEASIHGTDVSRQMMRIAVMNLVLHGIRYASLKRTNVLSEMSGLTEDDMNRRYAVILSNPPFAGQIPGTEEPRCWWTPFETIAENDYNLAASRYKPRVAEPVPDEDPAELIREVLAIELKITDGLQKLLTEVEQ